MLALNLDESDDVALIPAYITTAEIYIKNAVGNADGFFEQENVKPLYDTFYGYLNLESTKTRL